jgi:hypothetical protein
VTHLRTLLLGTLAAATLLATVPAMARPQLHTASIGWMEPGDLTCEPTSDHTCTVNKPMAWTLAEPLTDKNKYRVRGGTELVILNDGGNDLFYHTDDKADAGNVEVAIVIPADWGKDHELHPLKSCHLKTSGKFPPIVSLACSANKVGTSIGWVKSADVACGVDDECAPQDNYTDVGKKGGLCATFGILVYDHPNGKPIGTLATDMPIVRSEQRQGYTSLFFAPGTVDAHLLPYDRKSLRQCG